MKAVICEQITKSFYSGDTMVPVIRGASFDMNVGEFMMLVGPSGCGKTTLISIIAGILHYDGGRCEVLGKDYKQLSERAIVDFRAQNIGFIFQSFNLLPSLTIVENVAIPLIINQVPWEEAMQHASELLVDVGLKDRLKNYPNQLSGGEQQRVAIARGLVHSPKLLVCDEPTSALDHHTGEKIMDVIKKMQHKLGTSILVVTHDPRIYQYADRIAHMDDGQITHIENRTSFQPALGESL
ncbi:MAG: ABC transporter ATP-binding protein [Rickettsiales bacterium]|nr:ABC transporter ATP-binding protein [Rickettsiales bacterium]